MSITEKERLVMITELKAAAAAKSPWKQATLSINGNKVEWGAKLVLLLGQENVVTVEAPPAIARALNLGLVNGGDLNIVTSPKVGDWVPPVLGKFEWTITPDAGKSGRITLVFYSREVVVPWVHQSAVISSNLADEVTVLLNGEAMPSRGANFIAGQPNLLTLEYKNGDLLAGAPLAIDVEPLSGVVPSDFICVPELRELSTKHEWTLTGKQLQSGIFKLKLYSEGEGASLLTPANRLSREIFRFLNLLNFDLPLPPGQVVLPRNLWLVFRVRLMNSDGSPAVGVDVTFTAPEHEPYQTKTDASGIALSAAMRFSTPGERVIKAVAELPVGATPLDLLVRITGGES